jgi:hypothetical protein
VVGIFLVLAFFEVLASAWCSPRGLNHLLALADLVALYCSSRRSSCLPPEDGTRIWATGSCV